MPESGKVLGALAGSYGQCPFCDSRSVSWTEFSKLLPGDFWYYFEECQDPECGAVYTEVRPVDFDFPKTKHEAGGWRRKGQ